MALSEWVKVKSLKSETAIDAFEAEYNLTIPSALRSCILAHNGGRPRSNVIKLENGEEVDVKAMLSYNEGDKENIFKVIGFFVDNYGTELLPFALDSAGNYFCVKNEKIVLWTQDNAVLAVCDSFNQFLENLHEI